MLIGPKLIILRNPKCATTFLARVGAELGLGSFIASSCVLPVGPLGMPMHAGFHQLPEAMRDRFIIGTLRNPLGWYPSFFHYFAQGNEAEPAPRIRSWIHVKDGKPDFKASLARMIFPREHHLDLDTPMDFFGIGSNVMPGLLQRLQDLDCGLCTWWFLWCFHRDPLRLSGTIDRIIHGLQAAPLQGLGLDALFDSARARDGLPLVLERAGQPPSAEQLQFIRDAPARNVNRDNAPEEERTPMARHYDGARAMALYDEEMLGWVKQKDRLFFEVFNYTMDGAGGPATPIFQENRLERSFHQAAPEGPRTVREALAFLHRA